MVLAAIVVVGVPGQAAPPPEIGAESVALSEPGEPVVAGWTGEAHVDPEIVGLQWQGSAAATFTIETRDGLGAWSPVGIVEAMERDEGPDDGSVDAAAAPAGNVTEPMWVGDGVTGVRVRVDGGSVTDVELHAVDASPAGAGERVVADGQPLVAGSVPGSGLRVVALMVLVTSGVGLVRSSGAPTRSRRRRRAIGVVLVAALGVAACTPAKEAPPPPPSLSDAAPADMITRAEWGADESLRLESCPSGPTYMAGVRFAVVHHTVNSNTYSASQVPQVLRGIYAYHTQSLGYCDIAYSFLVDRFGKVYEGRYGGAANAVMGAHARGFNTSSTGIALIGDFRTFVPPPVALTALQELLAWKLGVHEIDAEASISFTTTGNEKYAANTSVTLATITYHNFTGNTECPGKQVIDRMDQIRAGVAELMDDS